MTPPIILNDIKDAAALVAPMVLAVLPLVAVLPSSPPLVDATTPTKPRRRIAGWRITVTIGRA